MSLLLLIWRSLKYYIKANIAIASGIAIATTILCGAIIVGDSMQKSLMSIVQLRLGNTTHTISAGERIFTQEFAKKISHETFISASPILKTQAVVTIQDKNSRVNNVQVWAIDSTFNSFIPNDNLLTEPSFAEAYINRNLAKRFDVDVGDFFLARFKNIGPIPSNTPFVSNENQIITRRIKVSKIIDSNQGGDFNLQASQISPYNIFVSIEWLNRVFDLDNSANLIVLSVESEINNEQIFQKVNKNWQILDLSLELNFLKNENAYLLSSQRVFIDEYLSEKLIDVFPSASFYLSYFVNSISGDNKSTPYSFVIATNEQGFELKNNQIIINQWLANDLNASIGDSLELTYFEVGAHQELTENSEFFIIVDIVPMSISSKHKNLMPNIPGLSDAGSCSDWNAGIPIDLNKIRQKDEDYWDDYKGTPKAYISLKKGQELWSNRFGNLTGIKIYDSKHSEQSIVEKIKKNINPLKIEFQINNVQERGIKAAKNSEDFGQLFAGLGIFIIVAGFLLTILLINLSLKSRTSQIRLYDSLGFSINRIRLIVLTEIFIISIVGVIIGMVLSVIYSNFVLWALNAIWQDIVRTETISLSFEPKSLMLGALSCLIISVIVAFITIRKTINKLNWAKKRIKSKNKVPIKSIKIFSLALLLINVIIILFKLITNDFDNIFYWFIIGIILLVIFSLLIFSFLNSSTKKPNAYLSLNKLSKHNLMRNPARSFSIIIMLALGSFVIVITAANRNDAFVDVSNLSSGTGGFSFFAESTVPILKNLNKNKVQNELGFSYDIDFVQFLSSYDDDASCLNLNQVVNPRILGVNPKLLKNRFSFVSKHSGLDKNNPWESLQKDFNGVVPAIADQTVIRWGMDKSIGDTLTYLNSSGQEIKLLLIGGLDNSIFQGNVIISEKYFKSNFPAVSGSNVFLIETPTEFNDKIADELDFIFRDYGWNMTEAGDKLAEFNSVENTYLSIFFLLGALGMLIGIVGLTVIIAQSIIERKKEIAIMLSMGFSYTNIVFLFFKEYFFLFSIGILAGIISAIISNLPGFISGNTNVSIVFLVAVIFALFINGILWNLIITRFMVKKVVVLNELRND